MGEVVAHQIVMDSRGFGSAWQSLEGRRLPMREPGSYYSGKLQDPITRIIEASPRAQQCSSTLASYVYPGELPAKVIDVDLIVKSWSRSGIPNRKPLAGSTGEADIGVRLGGGAKNGEKK